MDLGIHGKTAMVTACSSGLGLSVARRLAMEGCNLALFARSEDKLEQAAKEIRSQFNVQVVCVAGDMTKQRDVENYADACRKNLGDPDILALNTGRPPLKMTTVLGETDPQRWEQAYQTQLLAITIATRVIVPRMIGRGWGRIIGITSASVARPMTNHALSTVYRAGATALYKHLANEIAKYQITVNTVEPASIGTPALLGSYDMSERIKRVPLQRLGTPEEFAATVAYLVSEHAGFITGTNLLVDGGMAGALQ